MSGCIWSHIAVLIFSLMEVSKDLNRDEHKNIRKLWRCVPKVFICWYLKHFLNMQDFSLTSVSPLKKKKKKRIRKLDTNNGIKFGEKCE